MTQNHGLHTVVISEGVAPVQSHHCAGGQPQTCCVSASYTLSPTVSDGDKAGTQVSRVPAWYVFHAMWSLKSMLGGTLEC